MILTETVHCLLCRGVVTISQSESEDRYKEHLKEEHSVYFYLSWIIQKTLEEEENVGNAPKETFKEQTNETKNITEEYKAGGSKLLKNNVDKKRKKKSLIKVSKKEVKKNKENEEYVNNVKRQKMSEGSGKLQITPVVGKKLPNSFNTETKESSFQKCNFCNKPFETNDDLKVHIEDLHQLISCSSCSASLPTKEDYFSHRQSKCPRQCLICEETFSGELLLNEHINGQQCQ